MNDDSLEHGCAYREFEVNVLSDYLVKFNTYP